MHESSQNWRQETVQLTHGNIGDDYQRAWFEAGEHDPDWGVLTYRGRRKSWGRAQDEFYHTGVEQVTQCLALLPYLPHGKALDFGAGTGRLSFALAERFTSVTCVDVSPSMREVLLFRARTRGIENLVVMPCEAMPLPDHEFVLSLMTLQHLSGPREIQHTLQVIVASLSQGGLAILEVPTAARGIAARLNTKWHPKYHMYLWGRRLGISVAVLHAFGIHGFRMSIVDRGEMKTWIELAGGEVIAAYDCAGRITQTKYVLRRL